MPLLHQVTVWLWLVEYWLLLVQISHHCNPVVMILQRQWHPSWVRVQKLQMSLAVWFSAEQRPIYVLVIHL